MNNHTEHHGIQRDVEVLVDLDQPLGPGDGTVTSKGPGASRGSRGTANATEQSEDHERDKQANGSTGAAHGAVDDDGDGLGVDIVVDEVLDVGEDEDDGNEEEQTSEGVDEDGCDHGLGNLDSGVLDFFAHARNIAAVSFCVGFKWNFTVAFWGRRTK